MTFLITRGNWGSYLLYRALACMWSPFPAELSSEIGCRDIKYEFPHVFHVNRSVRLFSTCSRGWRDAVVGCMQGTVENLSCLVGFRSIIGAILPLSILPFQSHYLTSRLIQNYEMEYKSF